MLKATPSLMLIVLSSGFTAAQIHMTIAPPDIQVDQENGATDGVGDSVVLSAKDGSDDSAADTTASNGETSAPGHSAPSKPGGPDGWAGTTPA